MIRGTLKDSKLELRVGVYGLGQLMVNPINGTFSYNGRRIPITLMYDIGNEDGVSSDPDINPAEMDKLRRLDLVIDGYGYEKLIDFGNFQHTMGEYQVEIIIE